MIGEFERKLVRIYIEKNYPDYNWLFYVIKDDIMTINCKDHYNNIKEIYVTLDDLIK
jgi:hypothetical protein